MTSPTDTPGPIAEQRDTSVIEKWDLTARIYRRWDCGVLVEERPFTEAENAEADARLLDEARQANRALLLERARTALATNRAYLDLVAAGTATTADHIAQVPALTRQMQGVIRLLIGADLLDQLDTDGG